MIYPPRTRGERRQDSVDRLARDVDVWVATADAAAGVPYLTPLSFLWDGTRFSCPLPRPVRPDATCGHPDGSGWASGSPAT